MRLDEAPTNTNGEVAERHVASTHIARGELTLCELYIDYDTFIGVAADAPECERCAQLDC